MKNTKVHLFEPFIWKTPQEFTKGELLFEVEMEGKEPERHSCVLVKEDKVCADPQGYGSLRYWLKCGDGQTRIFFVTRTGSRYNRRDKSITTTMRSGTFRLKARN